jgi:hypothetical protein
MRKRRIKLLNNKYIIIIMYTYIFLNFTYPLRCLSVPQVEYHWSRAVVLDGGHMAPQATTQYL